MRLSLFEIEHIKQAARAIFGEATQVYLFGSRVDDSKRGGDIDLYITGYVTTNLFEQKLRFLARVKQAIGDQRIDVVFHTDRERRIEQEARTWGIRL